jgi:hypothetical protein
MVAMIAVKTLDIELEGKIYSSEFEKSILSALEKNNERIENVQSMCINLRYVDYLDVIAMLNVVAFAHSVNTMYPKCEIKFKLPAKTKVLTLLKVWRFYEAIEVVTNKGFDTFLDVEDEITYRNELGSQERYSEDLTSTNRADSDAILKLANEGKYFPIQCFKLTPNITNGSATTKAEDVQKHKLLEIANRIDSKKEIVESVAQSWKLNEIKDVISRVVKDKDGNDMQRYAPSSIVFECLTNAFRHPKCDIFMTSSKFSSKNQNEKFNKDFFTIGFWDNGNSMIDGLEKALTNKENVKVEIKPFNYPIFYIKSKDETGPLYKRGTSIKIDSAKNPYDVHFYESINYIFPATFFAGITTKILGEDSMGDNPDVANTQWTKPGMGLALLLDTVVNTFDGKIIVRSGRHRMVLQGLKGDVEFNNTGNVEELTRKKYAVSIKEVSDKLPYFKGNLLAIHLPLPS